MPYRRLPNTDSARLKALKTAYYKGLELSPANLAISTATYHRVKTFLPVFEQEIGQFKVAFTNQVEKSRDYLELQKKAKLYISHFLQVMNFAIARGKLPRTSRIFYGFGENNHRIPALNTESEILKWGEMVIKGESDRIGKGGNIITNPTSALVKVWYERFQEACRYQKNLQKITVRAMSKVSALRAEADIIILNVWNEVENTFRFADDDEKREKTREYGVIYFFRRNEKENLISGTIGEERARNLLQALDHDNEPQNEDESLQYSFLFPENQEN